MKSKILYLVAVAYFLSGFSTYGTKIPTSTYKQLDPSVTAHLNLLSLHQIGLLFMITSAVAFVLTLFKQVNLGYSLMTFVLMFWTLLYVQSWIQTGYWQSIYGIANYLLTTGILILCSRIVEMPKVLSNHTKELPMPLVNLHMKGESK